jgi:predicted TIM-barrel fold metal-dependent hydrolase
MLIVDCQVHIWENAKMGAHHRQVPTFSKDELLNEMDAAGVDAAVICPPFTLFQVNELAFAAARQHPDRLSVMAWFPLDDPKQRGLLENWRKEPGLRGFRWVLSQPHQRDWLRDGSMDWLWPALAAAKLPVALLASHDLAGVGQVAERHPDLRLMLDHLGCITFTKDDEAFAHVPELLALARYPNIGVKLSGAPSNSSEAYPYRNIHKYIRQMVETFGPERCFWGTDISRMPCSYRQCVTMFTEEMPWLQGRALELVMGGALCEWLGWRPPEQ